MCSQPQESLLTVDFKRTSQQPLCNTHTKNCPQTKTKNIVNRTLHSKHSKGLDKKQKRIISWFASNLEHKTHNNYHDIKCYMQALSNKLLQLQQHQFASCWLHLFLNLLKMLGFKTSWQNSKFFKHGKVGKKNNKVH